MRRRVYRSRLATVTAVLRSIQTAPQSANAISKRLHINYRTVTEDLNRLVEAGLASVSASKGVRFYGCTTEGRRLLNNLDECAKILEPLDVQI